MNSDYDITLRSDESSRPESERNRFLDSFGLKESGLSAETEPTAGEAPLDEGVVLSSQTEEHGLASGPVDLSRGRSLSVSVGRVPDRNRKLAISVSTGDRSNRSEQIEEASPCAKKTESIGEDPKTVPSSDHASVNAGDLDATLNLDCPECGGELVLKRRHLGIEGACVWCHTPIIAAESARDSQVRVYPILGKVSPSATPKAPAVAESPVVVDARPAPTETNIAPVMKVEDEFPGYHTSIGLGFSGDINTTNSVVGEESSSESPNVKPGAPALQPPFDFDAPYGTNDTNGSNSVSQPVENPVIAQGFGETLANNPDNVGKTHMAGFGTFLQAASPLEVTDIIHPPSISSETSSQSRFAPENPELRPNVSEGAAAREPIGFSASAPWGPPSNAVPVSQIPVDAVNDSPPVSLPPEEPIAAAQNGFLAASGATAFESPEKIAPPVQQSLPPIDFATAFGPTGFESAGLEGDSDFGGFTTQSEPSIPFHPVSFENPEPAEQIHTPASETIDSSGFFFHHSPAAKLLFGEDAAVESRSFAMPGNNFSTGSSSEAGDPKQQSPFEAKGLMSEKSWGISEPTGLHSGDEAPIPMEPGREELSPLKKSLTSSLEDSPFPAFSETLRPASLIPGTPTRAFSDLQPAPAPPLLQPGESTSPTVVGPTETNIPNVTSRPLAAKPKVRKGFVILMVIIIGFASGAALASFVLPVDEYVQTARAFMEQKFTPGTVVEQLPSVSQPPAAPDAPVVSATQP